MAQIVLKPTSVMIRNEMMRGGLFKNINLSIPPWYHKIIIVTIGIKIESKLLEYVMIIAKTTEIKYKLIFSNEKFLLNVIKNPIYIIFFFVYDLVIKKAT